MAYETTPTAFDGSTDFCPTDRCTSCGVEFENSHYTCQGHQWCLPECPLCGGTLEAIAETKE